MNRNNDLDHLPSNLYDFSKAMLRRNGYTVLFTDQVPKVMRLNSNDAANV